MKPITSIAGIFLLIFLFGCVDSSKSSLIFIPGKDFNVLHDLNNVIDFNVSRDLNVGRNEKISGTLTVTGNSSLHGHDLVGKGTSIDPNPRTDSVLTIAEDGTDVLGVLRNGLYVAVDPDEDLAGGDFSAGQYNILLNNSGLESTDADTVTSREHWDALVDGDVASDTFTAIDGAKFSSQTFTTGATKHYIQNVLLEVYGSGTPGTITVQIKAVDGASKPTGAVLTSGTYSTAITTDPAGEAIIVPVTKWLPTASTQYAIIVSQSASNPNEVNWSRDSLGGYANGVSWNSTDSGATWVAETGDFMFATIGVQATSLNSIRMQWVQFAGSVTGTHIGTFKKVDGYDISIAPSFDSTLNTLDLVGYDVSTLSVTPVPTRSYGIRIQTAGNGATSWAAFFGGDTQTTSKLLLGGSATTKSTSYLNQPSTGQININLGNTPVYLFKAASFEPNTDANQILGNVGKRWLNGAFKDLNVTNDFNVTTINDKRINIDSNLTFNLSNGQIQFKKGGNAACQGLTTMVGGASTVITTCADGNYMVHALEQNNVGGLGAISVNTKATGSFNITSTNVLDTSDVAWWVYRVNN